MPDTLAVHSAVPVNRPSNWYRREEEIEPG